MSAVSNCFQDHCHFNHWTWHKEEARCFMIAGLVTLAIASALIALQATGYLPALNLFNISANSIMVSRMILFSFALLIGTGLVAGGIYQCHTDQLI